MRHLLLLPILLIAGWLAFGQAVSPIPPDARTAMQELRKEPFRAHTAFLADDLLEGRGTGKRGHEIAALYVAEQFEAVGLKPAGQNGTFYQRVPLREITVELEKCAVTLTENGSASQLKWGDDFIMRGSEVSPEASLEAPVVFVGYGVSPLCARACLRFSSQKGRKPETPSLMLRNSTRNGPPHAIMLPLTI
jgi:hypothetical protein